MTAVDEAIISSINAFAVFQHRQGEILALNKVAACLFGWNDPADVIGKNFFDFLDEESQRVVKQSIENGGSELLYVKGYRKDGSLIHLVGIPDTTSLPGMARMGIFIETRAPVY
jgi:PAS domain S-box-containing protein